MVGRVLGTKDATPLEFWVGVSEGEFIQLDDVVALERVLPTGEVVRMYGTVGQVIARHEGARFDSDVFLIEDGILPAEVSEAAQVTATRFEPEVFVPPRPGQAVRIAEGEDDQMVGHPHRLEGFGRRTKAPGKCHGWTLMGYDST